MEEYFVVSDVEPCGEWLGLRIGRVWLTEIRHDRTTHTWYGLGNIGQAAQVTRSIKDMRMDLHTASNFIRSVLS